LLYTGLAAAIRNLHSSGIAVIATRRDDILVNVTSFELKMMPSVGSLIAHAAANVVQTYCDDSVKRFADFLQFVRPMMSGTTADGGSGSRSGSGCQPSSDSHSCSRDKWDFASGHVVAALRFVELEHEIMKHSEVHLALCDYVLLFVISFSFVLMCYYNGFSFVSRTWQSLTPNPGHQAKREKHHRRQFGSMF
jgi:hypothetical protein